MASIIYQVQKEFESQLRIGDSRHKAKKAEDTKYPEGIFSYGTFETYMKQACHFAKWAKATYTCNTLEKARPYVEEYLRLGIERGLSTYTLSTRRAALCKLYHCSATDIDIKLPERLRANITRSRNAAQRDESFSLEHNALIVAFCKGTGLRRHELAQIKPANIRIGKNGKVTLVGIKGKGGKVRSVKVLDAYKDAVIEATKGKEVEERLFPRVPSHMDVHGYRREYAQVLYDGIARPISHLFLKEKYICRGDKKGVVYDRAAMQYVSNQLGHNRISIIAGHYLS